MKNDNNKENGLSLQPVRVHFHKSINTSAQAFISRKISENISYEGVNFDIESDIYRTIRELAGLSICIINAKKISGEGLPKAIKDNHGIQNLFNKVVLDACIQTSQNYKKAVVLNIDAHDTKIFTRADMA